MSDDHTSNPTTNQSHAKRHLTTHTPPPPPHHNHPPRYAKALSAAEAKDLKEVEAGLPKLAAEAKAAQEALAKKTSARCVFVVIFVCFFGVCMGFGGG